MKAILKVKTEDIYEERIKDINDLLVQLEKDCTIPKNTRVKIKKAMAVMTQDKNLNVKVDTIMQELDEIANDPNLPTYTKTQIWNVISILETLNGK